MYSHGETSLLKTILQSVGTIVALKQRKEQASSLTLLFGDSRPHSGVDLRTLLCIWITLYE